MTAMQLPLSPAQRHADQPLFLNVTLPQRSELKLLAHDAPLVRE